MPQEPQQPHFRSGVEEWDKWKGDIFPVDRSILSGFGKRWEPERPRLREPLDSYRNPAPVDPYKPTVSQETPPPPSERKNLFGLPGGLGGLSLSDVLALILGGKELVTGSGRNQTGSGNPALDAQLAEMLKLQQGRLTKSEPLYDAILSMAGGLMPVQYQPRAQTALPTPTPTPTGGNRDVLDETRPEGKRG